MLRLESEGASLFLDLVEGSINGRRPTEEEIDMLLSTGSFNFMVRAYSKMLGLSREDFAAAMKNLRSDRKAHSDPLKAGFEEGFRSCRDPETVAWLRKRIKGFSGVDFGEAERIALSFLPQGTPLESTIFLTVDSFNPGMVYEGDIGLSVLSMDPENLDTGYLAHELHHVGFRHWVGRDPELIGAFGEPKTPGDVAVKLILHLISEGLANHFCTPEMVRAGPGGSERKNEKIRIYEESLEQMLGEVWSLVSDCLLGREPLGICEERLRDMVLDREGVLPKVHFIGERIVSLLDLDPGVERAEIIELCRRPRDLIGLYRKIAERNCLPEPSKEAGEALSSLFLGQ